MRPYVHAAYGVVGLALLGSGGVAAPKVRMVASVTSSSAGPNHRPLTAICPAGSLPDRDACVPFRSLAAVSEGEELAAQSRSHRTRRGVVEVYDQVGRRAERPAGYELYRWPVPPPSEGDLVMSGYDLDRPDTEQRRGAHLKATGHGGVDLNAPRGTRVESTPLEHEEGDAVVVYAGPLFGTTVLTRHTVREAGRLRTYLVLHGHLDAIAEGIAAGSIATPGTVLGLVGDSGSEGIVHLHLEIRQVRDEVDITSEPGPRLVQNEVSIPVDPRNVLPLREPPP